VEWKGVVFIDINGIKCGNKRQKKVVKGRVSGKGVFDVGGNGGRPFIKGMIRAEQVFCKGGWREDGVKGDG
jgi:hypothetical protein